MYEKYKKIFRENTRPILNTYQDAMDYISMKQKEMGRDEFLSSDEYKKIYPLIKKLHSVEKSLNKQETKKLAQKAMEEAGVSFGDRVEYVFFDMFMGANHYTGTIIDKNGIPYVTYDKGLKDMQGNKSGRWHKGWKKI